MARHRQHTTKRWIPHMLVAAALTVTGLVVTSPAAQALDTNAPIMTGRAFALSTNGLVKLPPVADTGFISRQTDFTVNKCVLPVHVGLLLAARGICSNVSIAVPPTSPVAGVSAGASVANVTLSLPGLPVIALRTVSAAAGTGCGGSNGTTEIGFLKIGTKTVISNLIKPAPNTIINLLGVKLLLNEQINTPGGLIVNGVDISVGGTLNVLVASATANIANCNSGPLD
jgi:hypothetical protein